MVNLTKTLLTIAVFTGLSIAPPLVLGNTLPSPVPTLSEAPSDSIKNAAATQSFSIRAGALVEAVYVNAPSISTRRLKAMLSAYQNAVDTSGGKYLASFEVLKNAKGNHAVTHVVLVQWPDAATRSFIKTNPGFQSLSRLTTDIGFFATQQDTPVTLRKDKIYDFTSAWTIATEPAHMPVVMQVLGTYFQKIGPVTQKYGISTTAFFGRHPAPPQDGSAVYAPDLSGIFEWQRLEDHPKFNRDPMFTEHVDIRNAVLSREEEVLFTRVML